MTLGITLNLSVRCLDKNQALMQRDIASINLRMASPDYTSAGSVSLEVHREQIWNVNQRISELTDENRRVWERINELADR